MKLLRILVFLSFATATVTDIDGNRTLAFPGAEGFGAYSKGGRGGQILFVTNLNDYNPKNEEPIAGSLRWA